MAKCGDCKHYQKTKIIETDITGLYGPHRNIDDWDRALMAAEPYLPKSYLWDCPYADDWCEAEYEANTLCDGRFEAKEQ